MLIKLSEIKKLIERKTNRKVKLIVEYSDEYDSDRYYKIYKFIDNETKEVYTTLFEDELNNNEMLDLEGIINGILTIKDKHVEEDDIDFLIQLQTEKIAKYFELDELIKGDLKLTYIDNNENIAIYYNKYFDIVIKIRFIYDIETNTIEIYDIDKKCTIGYYLNKDIKKIIQ